MRLSYALYEWVDLGRKYPPARQALDEVREGAAQALLRGEGVANLFHDIVAIDEALGQSRATYAFYVALLERQSALADECMPQALPVIVAAEDYALADRVRQEPDTRQRERIDFLRLEMHVLKRRKPYVFPMRRYAIEHYARDVRLHAAISAGVGRHDEARRLTTRALGLIADPSLRNAVQAQLMKRSTTEHGRARANHRHAKALRREARHQAA